MTHPNARIIERFYDSLGEANFDGIRDCYAPDAVFSDPMFGELHGDRALAMWHMLCVRAKGGLKVVYRDVRADDASGSAHWEADYRFTRTGRPVHNVISSRFGFANGRIVEHRDTFDVYRWASMALGPTGRLLGWTPPMKKALHRQTLQLLDQFIAATGTARPPTH